MKQGILYIVSTPIGNLQDITLRALDVLKTCDYILSEDTRETSKLLNKFGITTPQLSYRDQNHNRTFGQILELLSQNKVLALVSDSGTPLVSDPGFKLVNQLVLKGYAVTSIPGPSSVISALVVSGLPTDKFCFLGFLPKALGPRKKLLSEYGQTDSTLIIYESPYRVLKLLAELRASLGNRKAVVVSELTKIYEQVQRGTVDDLVESLAAKKLKGEYIVLVAKKEF